MARAYPEARATHFRLKAETWAIIGEEYRNGATARELAVKWMVSPTSIYRHACEDGWTKKACGDARSWANAREVEAREVEAQEARASAARERAARQSAAGQSAAGQGAAPASVQDRAADLFSGLEADEDAAAGPAAPAELARQATTASGRAMREGRWNEARALAGLAESYARLAERMGTSELTLANVPLALVAAIAEGPMNAWGGRMSLAHSRENDPENDIRRWFWAKHHARNFSWERQLSEKYAEGMERGRQVEAQARADFGDR